MPAFGVFSEVIATFSGKPLFGYRSMVIATMSIYVLYLWSGCIIFFRRGAGANVNAFFGIMVTFVIGGMTGVLLAVPPADFVLHNSLFLVAHFHKIVIGSVMFGKCTS